MDTRLSRSDLETFETLSQRELNALPCADVLVLTATNRLAVAMKNSWLNQIEKVSVLPAITPYKAWLNELSMALAFKCADMPLMLNETAQRYYWQQAITQTYAELKQAQPEDTVSGLANAAVFLNISSAAALMSQASRLQAEWDIEVWQNETNEEYQFFLACQKNYKRLIKTMWDTPALERQLLQAVKNGWFAIPNYIVLDGFYRLSPYQQKLLSAFQEKGATLYQRVEDNVIAKDIRVFSADSLPQELEGALQWASQILHQNSESSVAIVVPNLQENIAIVQRLAARCFQHASLENKWHIAIGRALSDWVLVRSVLQWFKLMVCFLRGNASVTQVGKALLNSQFLFTTEQQYALGQWDMRLRNANAIDMGKTDFLNKLAAINPEVEQAFQTALINWQGKKTVGQWAESYREILAMLGFPNSTVLSSVNYQLCHAFETSIHRFSTLDEMLPSLNAQEALEIVESELQQNTFQRQRTSEVRIDIIGLYEVEGGYWDNVWVLGLNDTVLPKAPHPNPYLPIKSQHRKQVLHASSESEQIWSANIFKAILHSTPSLTLSWQTHHHDEKYRPSRFLKEYLPLAKPLPLKPPAPSHKLEVDYLDDTQGLVKKGNVKGGYSILEKYSRNPLWGYATLRLHLSALGDYPQHTLTDIVKGNFFHNVMEKFYTHMRCQADLHDESRIDNVLNKVLTEAAKEELSEVSSTVLKKLTLNRAKAIIRSFIDVEKNNREPFDIDCVENKRGYSVNGLIFNFKVDRIDRLSNNERVFIDYKTGHLDTGRTYTHHWLEDGQLKNIQLPLYAVLFSDNPSCVAGISFVGLSRKEGFYVGLWNGRQPVGDDKQNVLQADQWQQAVGQWKVKLHKIFTEIEIGEAPNRFEKSEDIKYCDVLPFLRVYGREEGESDE